MLIMANWRPKGWVEQRGRHEAMLKTGGCPLQALLDWSDTYEAGADAMLEGLKKKGVRFTRKLIPIETSSDGRSGMDWMPAGEADQRGYLAFIPEEKI